MPWGKTKIRTERAYGYEKLEILPESGCCVCFALEKLLYGGHGTFGLQYEKEGFTCEPHESMLRWILASYNEWNNKLTASFGFRNWNIAPRIMLNATQYGLVALHVSGGEYSPMKTYEIILQKPHLSADIPIEVINMDASWIDLRIATMWKEKCINQHGSKCDEVDKIALVIPDWLIDTEQDRIVNGESAMEYVALSYRWGTSIGSKLDFDKLSELRKPGGLSDFIAKIPTIRDAAQVVRSINERYLWVDTICIRHDDKDHVAHQLQCMGAIYASSKLTIIASDGDGMAGLPGINGCSVPRNLANVFPWTNNRVIVVRDLPILDGSKLQSEYFQRGWTFQEYTLSRRRLIFGKQQIHWICGCQTYHEDLHAMNAQLHKPVDELSKLYYDLRRWPDFKKLSELLRAYNNRDMTYPEDTLPGIVGLLRLLNSSFHGGFLFGLPVMCFEAALLWHQDFGYKISGTWRDKKTAVRRRERSIRAHSLLPDSELPSWSWVGWNGTCLSLLEDEEDYEVSESQKWVTIPTTRWYCHDTPKCTQKHRVYSSWFDTHQDTTHPESLPEGWIRGKYPEFQDLDISYIRSFPYGITGDFIYHHREFPNSLFWRPFPVAQKLSIHTSDQIKQGKFLSCKTKRGWFRSRRKAEHAIGNGSLDYHLEIFDAHNRVCGWIQLPQEDEALPNHQHVELVVICERLLSNGSSSEGDRNSLNKLTYKHYYGVLLIEWDDNIAYRKGCGIIKKDMWDQHDTEDVDLILG